MIVFARARRHASAMTQNWENEEFAERGHTAAAILVLATALATGVLSALLF